VQHLNVMIDPLFAVCLRVTPAQEKKREMASANAHRSDSAISFSSP
jgi:hypothetical protein